MSTDLTYNEMLQMHKDLTKMQRNRALLQDPMIQKQVAKQYVDFQSKNNHKLQPTYIKPTTADSAVFARPIGDLETKKISNFDENPAKQH